MLYRLKVRVMKTPRGDAAWRRLQAWRRTLGGQVDLGSYGRLSEYIGTHAPGHSFVDIGCMWGVNGRYSFLAEEVGATAVKGVDVFGPTPEFESEKRARGSSVEFILGDAGDPDTIARVGVVDIVFCAGVLYHHPSPFDLLTALRRMCRHTLILRTSTIPEMVGVRNGAIYFPMLDARQRAIWDVSSLETPRQIGITDAFDPAEGYGNWFWGMTPSCVGSLLQNAGFEVIYRATEGFAQTFVCRTAGVPFDHRLPGEGESRELAARISAEGIARPA